MGAPWKSSAMAEIRAREACIDKDRNLDRGPTRLNISGSYATTLPTNIKLGSERAIGSTILSHLYDSFRIGAFLKIEAIKKKPEKPGVSLSQSLHVGQDFRFDQLITAMSRASQSCLAQFAKGYVCSVLDNMNNYKINSEIQFHVDIHVMTFIYIYIYIYI